MAPLPPNHAKPKVHSELTHKVVSKTGTDDALESARKVELKAKKLAEGINVFILK